MIVFPRHLATRLFNAPIALALSAAPLTLQLLERSLAVASADAHAAELQASEGWHDRGRGGNARAERDRPYDVVAGVAIIPVKGVLIQRLGWLWNYGDYLGVSGYDRLRFQLMHALQDDEVDAIAFDIDSPGGEVAGCFDLVDTIHAARGTKPIAAILGESAFSAAYAIASAVDPGRLWVPRTGGTGSVGVIYQHLSIADWLAKTGIVPTLVTKGALKGEGSDLLKLAEGALERLQTDVDWVGALFDQIVSRNRGLSEKDVANTEAGTFLGAKGVDVGFADHVASPDQAFRALLKQLG